MLELSPLLITLLLAPLIALITFLYKRSTKESLVLETRHPSTGDVDCSNLRARRKTEFIDYSSPSIIGSKAWIDLKWNGHLERVGAGAKRNGFKGKINIKKECSSITNLKDQEKYLQAGSKLLLLISRTNLTSTDLPDIELIKLKYCFALEFKSRLKDEEGWTLSSDDKKNIRKVWYKPSTTKEGSLLVKVNCTFKKCDILHLMSFAKECHTCKSWIPFTRHAAKIVDIKENLGIESVVHVCIGIPGIARDILLHIWCNDSLDEEGKFYFFCNSVGEGGGVYGWHDIFKDKGVKEPPSKLAVRASIKYTAVEITMTGADTFDCEFISEVDPYIVALPQTLLNFALRKIVAIAVGLVEGLVQRMTVDLGGTAMGRIVLENSGFYVGVLGPKFEVVKKKFREKAETNSVSGWALKDILGSLNLKRKKRRFFVYSSSDTNTSNVTNRKTTTLKYYDTDKNIAGMTPMKIMFIEDAVLGEKNGGRCVLVSELLKNGNTRMVSLEFDSKIVAGEMVEKLKIKKPEGRSPKKNR